MNKDILEGHWKEFKGKFRQKWGEFTEDELDKLHGKYDELRGAIQKKYGYDKDKVDKDLTDFIRKIDEDSRHH